MSTVQLNEHCQLRSWVKSKIFKCLKKMLELRYSESVFSVR